MIKVFKNSDEIGHFVGELLVQDISISGGSHYAMSLSGGSTPKAVYSFLAERYADRIPWDKMNFFWGDERCVLPSDNDSNYKMAMEMLLSRVSVLPDHVFRIIGENIPNLEAIRYSNLVGEHLSKTDGLPSFNFMLLGLGDDGHTASIYPDQLNLFEVPQLYEVVTHPVSGQLRITATGRLINQAKKLVFIVTGKSKASVVSQIIQKKADDGLFPASLVRPQNGELFWLLDEDAAAKIDPSMFS